MGAKHLFRLRTALANKMAGTVGRLSAPTLGDLNKGTDNNLTLLRAAAAISVALSHSYLTVTGDPDSRPLLSLTGFSIGYHAVNVFFFVSGLLVTQSWVNRSSLITFSVARGLRIFPALIASTFVVTFLFGSMMTSLSLTDYLTSADTFRYFFQTATLIEPSGVLPGVFAQAPDSYTVNGSLWTLRYELICYIALAIIGFSGVFHQPRIFLCVSVFAGLALIAMSTLPIAHDNTVPIGHVVRFGLCFGLGVIAFQFQRFIVVHWSGVVVLIAIAALAGDTVFYPSILYVTTAYSTLWLAYVPKGRIRLFNNAGDYSYGIYIYTYPIQQTLVSLFPSIAPAQMFALTVLLTLPLAVASWHLIEKPALRLKSTIIDFSSNRMRKKTATEEVAAQSRR